MRIIQSLILAVVALFGMSLAQLHDSVSTNELLSGTQPFLPPPITINGPPSTCTKTTCNILPAGWIQLPRNQFGMISYYNQKTKETSPVVPFNTECSITTIKC